MSKLHPIQSAATNTDASVEYHFQQLLIVFVSSSQRQGVRCQRPRLGMLSLMAQYTIDALITFFRSRNAQNVHWTWYPYFGETDIRIGYDLPDGATQYLDYTYMVYPFTKPSPPEEELAYWTIYQVCILGFAKHGPGQYVFDLDQRKVRRTASVVSYNWEQQHLDGATLDFNRYLTVIPLSETDQMVFDLDDEEFTKRLAGTGQS